MAVYLSKMAATMVGSICDRSFRTFMMNPFFFSNRDNSKGQGG